MKYFFVGLLFMSTACSSIPKASDLGRLRLGMTRSQIVDVMGEPRRSETRGNIEFLVYDIEENGDHVPIWLGLKDSELDIWAKPSRVNGMFDDRIPKPQESASHVSPAPPQPTTINNNVSPVININAPDSFYRSPTYTPTNPVDVIRLPMNEFVDDGLSHGCTSTPSPFDGRKIVKCW